MELLDHPVPVGPFVTDTDIAAARRSLREQVAKLERDIGAAVCAGYPRLIPEPARARRAGPRLLDLGELEQLRDDLDVSLRRLRGDAAELADRQEASRLLIERMLLRPDDHRWVRVSNADIGEPGCKHWHVRPRLGLIGMLAGWWHVKISSGCPLPRGSRHVPRPRI